MNCKKVAVGLSGGVDSAVSAWLLKQQGYEVVGVHLYCWPPKEEYLDRGSSMVGEIERENLRKEWIKKNGCRADEDRASALKTALEIGIPFKELDFSEEYNEKVMKYFYKEYEEGRTPNPDILCNSEIKFGLFLSWALENGFDYIATGHYAKVGACHGVTVTQCHGLFVPKDKHKDQTYFLWKLTEKELKHVLFPLGNLLKSEVREMAKEAKLSVFDKKDSQGICFVGNVEVREFLARRLQKKVGEVVDINGKVMGKHDGVSFYTIGQRGGWRLDPRIQKLKNFPLRQGYAGQARTQEGDVTPIYYVIDKDAKTNRLVVGEREEGLRNSFVVTEINTVSPCHCVTDARFVRIRHGGELVGVKIDLQGQSLKVEVEREIFGVASGQSAVFYGEDGECLGGGVII